MTDYCGKKILANYFRGSEAVGGKLYLYEDSLVFKSHIINHHRGEMVIKYKDILNIEKRNTCFIIPNGITILTLDGVEHKFVVFNRSNLIKFISSKLEKGNKKM